MIDARSDLVVRRSRENFSMAYSRKVTRRDDIKRDNSFKIRKTAASKASSPHMQTITKRSISSMDMLKQSVSATAWIIHDSLRRKTYGVRHLIEKEIASLTKIMTCIVALEMMEKHSIDHTVLIRVSKVSAGMTGTSANLPYGSWISLVDLLYALMLPSGNDAAYLLAEAFGLLMFYEKIKPEQNLYQNILSIDLTSYESTTNFVNHFIKIMNKKAKHLGLANTSFSNPHGLAYSINSSSARDILALSLYCYKNPLFMKIASAKQYTALLLESPDQELYEATSIEWKNTNKLLDQGWEGIKTGQTPKAGGCLVSVKDGIFIVVLNSASVDKRFEDSLLLYDWYWDCERSCSEAI